MAAARDDPFGGLDLGQQPPRPRPGAFIASSLIALAMIAGLAGVLVKALVDDRRASVHAAQGARMEALARGRAEVIATWVNGIAQTGRRLTEAELLRLFASELALHEPSEPLAQAVAEQLPYLQQMLDDFARQNGLVGAGLVDLEGRSVLLSSGAPPLRYNPAALLDQRTERWVSPVRSGDLDDAVILGARLLMDVALPVPVAQPWLAGEAPEIAAVLFMVVPVAEQLASLLDTKPLLGLGERFRLIQWSEHGSEQVHCRAGSARGADHPGGGPGAGAVPSLWTADQSRRRRDLRGRRRGAWRAVDRAARDRRHRGAGAAAPVRHDRPDRRRAGGPGAGACLRRLLVASQQRP